MRAIDFYNSVLPPFGLRALAVFRKGLGSYPDHFFFEANDDLIASAESYDSLGKNVYHGCATFKTAENRKATNVLAVKSLWVDLDTGPGKPYASAKDAAVAVEQFRLALGLKAPHFVRSGGGLHAYFPFNKPVSPENWKRLAAAFGSCMDHFGIKHDTSRTEDLASVLRIPGTHNYKTDPARDVVLVRLGEEDSAAGVYAKFKQYAQDNGILLSEPVSPTVKVTNDLVGAPPEYPPSEYQRIEAGCAAIAEVATTGGDTTFDVWRRAIGIAKHTAEPREAAIRWTRNRADTGHSQYDWEGELDRWRTGPTTCAELDRHCDHCGSCPHNGKIKSPIQLGVTEIPVVKPVTPEPEQARSAPIPPKRPWEFGAKWIVDAVNSECKVGYNGRNMTMLAQGEDGLNKHVEFCNRYWQVMRRVKSPEGIWQIEIAYSMYNGRPHETFLMDSAAVTSPDLLKKAFSARELHIRGGTRAMSKAQEILMYEQAMLYEHELETPTYPAMGWARVGNSRNGDLTGEFVLGDTVFRPKEKPQTVLIEKGGDAHLSSAFGQKGTVDEWTALIDWIYNRPGAEPYQFVLAAMFAAPLVRLVPGDGAWHGIPIALMGEGGAAKTSTALVGMSIYAKPSALQFNAQGSKDGQGDTINAFAAKVGALNNLPFIADEMTGVEPERMSSIMYMLANGKPKDRAGIDGKLLDNRHRWDTLSIATGNESFHDKLRGLQNQNAQNATQLRCFQIELKVSDLQQVFFDVHKTDIEQKLLDEQYGAVGRAWIQFLVNNREKVQTLLGERRRVFQIDDNDTSSIRFYKDLLMTVETAAILAKRLGFIQWDLAPMMSWAKDQVRGLRATVLQQDWESVFSDFVASLHGRTIVTREMKVGPGRRANKNAEMPLEPLSSAAPPVARRAIASRLFFVTSNAMTDWCYKNRVNAPALVNEMIDRGFIVIPSGSKRVPRLINLGSGTTVTRPQALCWELSYDKVADFVQGDEADTSNVVTLPVTPPHDPVLDSAASR